MTERSLGMTILGQTGFGKSAFFHNLIMDDIREGRSAIVFDPHGDLAQDILESLSNNLTDRVDVLSVNEDLPFGLNLYECGNRKSQLAIDRTVDNSILVFKRLMQSERDFHPHIEYLLRNTAYTVLANPTITMAEVDLMFAQSEIGKTFRTYLLKQINNNNIHNFWQGVEERRGNVAYQYIEPLLNKVSPFTTSEVMRMIVGQEHTTIPFSDYLDNEGKVLLIDLPIGILGEEKTQMLGMTILSLLSEHIYERVKQRKERRVPLNLYIDEAGLFFSSGTAISKLLKQGRKFGCHTHLSFQTLSDLPDKEAQSAVLQTGTMVFFQVIGGIDAEILSKQLKVADISAELVPKMRMEPNIRTWTTSEWISEEAYKDYCRMFREIEETRGKLIWVNEVVSWFETALVLSFPDNDSVSYVDHTRWEGLIEKLIKGEKINGNWQDIFRTKWQSVRIIHRLNSSVSRANSLYLQETVKYLQAKIEEWNRSRDYSEGIQYLRKRAAFLYLLKRDYTKKIESLEADSRMYREIFYVQTKHEEQDGWIPVKLEVPTERQSDRPNYSRRGTEIVTNTTYGTKDIQIYDMVKGTPRPFSDLWNEMQVTLATLPPYNCYIQTINGEKEITEMKLLTTPPPERQPYGEATAEAIKERSRQKFGRPAEEVKEEMDNRIKEFLEETQDKTQDGSKMEQKKPKIKIEGSKPLE